MAKGAVYEFLIDYYNAGAPNIKIDNYPAVLHMTPYHWKRHENQILPIIENLMPKIMQVRQYCDKVRDNRLKHLGDCNQRRLTAIKSRKAHSQKQMQGFTEQINPNTHFIPVQSSPRKFHEGFSDQHAIEKARENNKVESGLSFKD